MRNRLAFGVLFTITFTLGGYLTGSRTAWGDAKDVMVAGEVINAYCYATVGLKGENNRKCHLESAKMGSPIGLLEDNTGKIYVLLPSKDKTSLPQDVMDKVGSKAIVAGDTLSSGGSQFLMVKSVK